jgi:hypothetical protein
MVPAGDPALVPTRLEFRGRLTEEDAGHVRWYWDLLLVRRPVRWAAAAALTLLAGVAVWWAVEWQRPAAAVLFAGMWAYFVFAFARERRWAARRHFRRHSDSYLETRAALSGAGVEVENEAHRASYAWTLVGQVAVTPHGLMLCGHGAWPMLWLPDRVLGGGLRQQVIDLAASQGVAVRRLL